VKYMEVRQERRFHEYAAWDVFYRKVGEDTFKMVKTTCGRAMFVEDTQRSFDGFTALSASGHRTTQAPFMGNMTAINRMVIIIPLDELMTDDGETS
jgi:hypothetical protein